MTTRDSLHLLLDRLSDTEIEALARMARDHGLARTTENGSTAEPLGVIDARQYPALTAVWDNDDDAIFDDL